MFKDLRYQFFRLFVFMLPWGTMRTKLLIKMNVFQSVGNDFYFCPRKIPADPKYIIFHDNVSVAADVMFCNHDVMYRVFNNMKKDDYTYVKYYGCIEVMDNVFIGTKSLILPNVKIGSNVIVGAGSVVTKDLETGGIYAGNPAKRIGDFDEILKNRKKWTEQVQKLDEESATKYLWNKFFEAKTKEEKG